MEANYHLRLNKGDTFVGLNWKKKMLKALHVPANMQQSLCINHVVISLVAAGTLLLLILFFYEHLHILPELLSLEALPSAHLAEAQ